MRANFSAVAPYITWMVALFVLPSTAEMYALRSFVSLVILIIALLLNREVTKPFQLNFSIKGLSNFTLGIIVGLVVFVLWVYPERFSFYRDFSLLGGIGFGGSVEASDLSPYNPKVCGLTLTIIKLIGSAFIIAPIEELFFRSFLYRWLQRGKWWEVDLGKFDLSAFLWMVGIFALEHHTRLAVGAMAGAFYGVLAIRRGVGSAIVAHMTTNFVLGLYVIICNEWNFW